MRAGIPQIHTFKADSARRNGERWGDQFRKYLHSGEAFSQITDIDEDGRVYSRPFYGAGEFATLWYARKAYDPPFNKEELPVELFVLTRLSEERKELNGSMITRCRESVDAIGMPAVQVHFSEVGGKRLFELTRQNAPIGDSDHRLLSIILDEQMMTAPRIMEPIRDDCLINGKFTQPEIRRLVRLLQSGSLPLPLKPKPVEQKKVEPR